LWFQSILDGLTAGAVYALVGLGYVTIFRTSSVVNMAQGAFVMLGALICYSFLIDWGLPYWVAGLLAVVTVIVVGLLLYRLLIAPLVTVSPVTVVLATIGASLLFENIALLVWGGYAKALPPFSGDTPVQLWGTVSIQPQYLWVLGLTAVTVAALHVLGNRSRIGKKMTACADDPVTAGLCGIHPARMTLLAFAISALIGALGGISIASVSPISYVSGGMLGLNGFVAAILGGWGSSAGAIVGGLTLGVIEAVAFIVLPGGYKSAVAFAVLLLILYFRPSGILGSPMAEA